MENLEILNEGVPGELSENPREESMEVENVLDEKGGEECAEKSGGTVDGPIGRHIGDLREILTLLREAEEKGYERGRKDERSVRRMEAEGELSSTQSIWDDPMLREAEVEDKRGVKVGEEFLRTIRPSVWDNR